MVTRVRARVRRLGVRSIVVVARMVHQRRVGRRCTRRCLSQLALDLIVMLMMMLRVLLLVVVLIIPSLFALLLQVKNLQEIQLPQLQPL